MRFVIIIILTIFALQGSLSSNGMPFRISYVYKSSNPIPMNAPDIRILKESLNIKIQRDFSYVEVEYEMINDGNDITIDYGFPADYFLRAKTKNPNEIWNPEYISEFTIQDESGNLPVYEKTDSTVFQGKLKSRMIMYDEVDIARRWFFTKLFFNKGMKKNVKVNYRISNTVIDFLMSDMYFLLYSDRVFTYDFSPAAHFGDSTIGKLEINIDISNLLSCNCEYSAEFTKPFVLNEGVLSFSGRNLKPAELKDLTLKYRMDNVYKAETNKSLRFSKNWFKSIKTNHKISADSIALLFDGNPATGLFIGNGTSSGLEITFGKDSVSYIGFINGNTTDRRSFYGYPRVKSLKLEIYSKSLKKYTGKNYLILELKDNNYANFNNIHYGSFMTTLFDLGTDYYDDIKKIKLKVLDIYPGESNDKVFIGELFVYKYKNTDFKFNYNPD